MNVFTFEHKHQFVEESAAFMNAVCEAAPDRPTYMALSGGQTPQPVYESFAKQLREPSHVYVYEVDERYVPRGHADANACMIEKHLVRFHAEWAGVHVFDTSLSIRDALMVYTHMLSWVPRGEFDLMVLGVGTDGHIASLFPYSTVLSDRHSTVLHTTTAHHFVHDRLTLAPRMIMQAKRILILLQGEEKQPVYEELVDPQERTDAFPAHMLQSHPDVTVHYLI